MAPTDGPARPWRMDFDNLEGVKHGGKLDPPGFDSQMARDWAHGSAAGAKRRDPKLLAKQQEAVWQRASSPFRQVGFMCFMMWMMGNGIQIFSIIMTLSGLAQPIVAIAKSHEAFPPDPEGKLEMRLPRVLYCLINIGQVLFALYKLNAMGLLPTQPSDWLSTIPAPGALQHSFGALQ